MSLKELEERITKLERIVANLQRSPKSEKPWWQTGKDAPFKDDPGFEEVVRLGRAYRDSLKPKPRKPRKKKPKE